MTRPVMIFKKKFKNGAYAGLDKGIFHVWGTYKGTSTAIIELPDGSMVNQPVELFTFIDKD